MKHALFDVDFRKWIVIGVMLIILCLIALAAASIWSAYADCEQNAALTTKNLSHVLDEYINGFISKTDIVLLSVADEVENRIAHRTISKQSVDEYLLRQRLRVPEFNGLRVTNAKGDVIYGNEPVRNVNVADRDYFLQLRDRTENGMLISKPMVGRFTGNWAIIIARRINYPDGSFAGVVLAGITLDSFMKTFSKVNVGDHGIITLFDRDFSVMCRYPAPQGIGSVVGKTCASPTLEELLKKGVTSATYKSRSRIDGTERMYSFRKISGYPLYEFVGLAREDYIADWQRETVRILLLVGLFILVVLCLAWLLNRYFMARKKAEQTLRASETRLKTAIESIPFDFWMMDKDGKYVMQNSIAVKNWGNIIGKRPEDLDIDSGVLSVWKEYNERAFAGKTVSGDVKFIIQNSERFFHSIISPIHDGETVHGLLGINIDITERKRMEEALRKFGDELELRVQDRTSELKMAQEKLLETTKRFELATASGQLGIWDWDVKSDIMVWNDRMFELYGISKESFPKSVQGWQTSLHPDDSAQAMMDCRAALSGDKEFDTEFRVLHPSGTVKVLKANAIVIRDIEGKAVRMLGLNRDITEQKNLETELRRTTEELDTIFNAIPATVWYKDTKNRFIRVNKAAADLLGMAVDKINGKTAYDLFPAPEADKFYMDDLEVINSGFPKMDIIESVSMADGDLKWMNTDKIPQKDDDGNITGIIVISSDISELKKSYKALEEEINHRKRVEEQLRNLYLNLQAMREEERANIAREIHDELGQIMTAIKMDLAWLNKKYADHQTIHEKTLSTLNLIDKTLKSIKKICTELRPGILDHLGLGAALSWQAKEFEDRTGIRCKVEAEEDSEIDGNRSTALFRIFQEALTNVMRHADATEVTARLKSEASKITLEIKDNGKGISEEEITKSNSFGLLGMRERVYPWRGNVTISGTPTKGTTITVVLPIDDVLIAT